MSGCNDSLLNTAIGKGVDSDDFMYFANIFAIQNQTLTSSEVWGATVRKNELGACKQFWSPPERPKFFINDIFINFSVNKHYFKKLIF